MPFKDPIKAQEYRRRWRKENKAELSRKRRATNLKTFKLTPEQFDQMLAEQGGVCAVCKGEATGMWKSFHVDHNHGCCAGKGSCGKCIRGLLCYNCNAGIGLLRESSSIVESALTYLLNGEYVA